MCIGSNFYLNVVSHCKPFYIVVFPLQMLRTSRFVKMFAPNVLYPSTYHIEMLGNHFSAWKCDCSKLFVLQPVSYTTSFCQFQEYNKLCCSFELPGLLTSAKFSQITSSCHNALPHTEHIVMTANTLLIYIIYFTKLHNCHIINSFEALVESPSFHYHLTSLTNKE